MWYNQSKAWEIRDDMKWLCLGNNHQGKPFTRGGFGSVGMV